jgi:multidrug resistance efflux pump
MNVRAEDLDGQDGPSAVASGQATLEAHEPVVAPRDKPVPPQTVNGTAHAPVAPPASEPAVLGPRPRRRLGRIILPIVIVLLVVGAVIGFNIWESGQLFVSTDNASIAGQPVQVGSVNAGRVESVGPSIGSLVHQGDVLATVALPSVIGTAQNGTPRLGFLGAGDTRVSVTAPFDGVVIATPSPAGSTVQAGQAIVTIVDPTQLWVNANIDETQVGRVKVGQEVTVHVDALNADFPGRVASITPATSATFSLMPAQNTTGNFNKVTQQVPVRVSLNLGNQPTLLGGSVEVRINTGGG